jgi:L-glyceraldehyde 3-phosphate reductase
VRRAADRGVTHFDCANMYGPPNGSAEENLGRILKQDFGGMRDELVISTKAGYEMWPGPYGIGASKKYLVASLEQSLQRLGLDYVDIFYAHRPWPDDPMEETMEALAQLVKQGKTLYVGVLLQPAAHPKGPRAAEW